jgi:hypothetical protein
MNNFTGPFLLWGIYLAIFVVYTLPIWFLWIWLRDDLQSAVNAVFSVSKLICAGVAWLGGLFFGSALLLIPFITLAFDGWKDMDTTLKITGDVIKIALVAGACGLYSYRLWDYKIIEWKFKNIASQPKSIYSPEEILEREREDKYKKNRDNEEIRGSFLVILVGGVLWYSGIGGYIELLSILAVVISIIHIILVKFKVI